MFWASSLNATSVASMTSRRQRTRLSANNNRNGGDTIPNAFVKLTILIFQQVLTEDRRNDLARQAHDQPNPFEDEIPHISEYTAQEIAILQARLHRQLGPEYISTRQGPGGSKVSYLAADKVINLANEVLGFNGWSSSIRDTTIDYVDVDKDGRISMGVSMIIRVTLRDGTYHEDVGYGEIKNSPGKGAAFEKTKKEAATDALKRALRNFGNVLGNCLYDKDYLKKVLKVHTGPSKWDEKNLHRHPEFATKPRNPELPTRNGINASSRKLPPLHSMASAEVDDEFGGDAFADVDFTHTDEFELNDPTSIDNEASNVVPKSENQLQARPPQSAYARPNPQQQTGTGISSARPPGQQRASGAPNANGGPKTVPTSASLPAQQHPAAQRPAVGVSAGKAYQKSTPENAPPISPANSNAQVQAMSGIAVAGFVTGRVAEKVLQEPNGNLTAEMSFNPFTESPSIRKTTGFNHARSGPIRRDDVGAPPPPLPTSHANTTPNPVQRLPGAQHMNGQSPRVVNGHNISNVAPIQRPNFANPQQDPHRRIGAPIQAGLQSPGLRPGAYKAPGPAGVKRGPSDSIGRPPLGDMSNMNNVQPPGALGSDVKRPKIEGEGGTAAVGV